VIYNRQIIKMSNINASEENVDSPSTYGNEAYMKHRKEEKKERQQKSEESLERKEVK
jgi:hypothetical protein